MERRQFQRLPLGLSLDPSIALTPQTNAGASQPPSISISVVHLGTREMTTGWGHSPSGLAGGQTWARTPFITWPHANRELRQCFGSLGISVSFS